MYIEILTATIKYMYMCSWLLLKHIRFLLSMNSSFENYACVHIYKFMIEYSYVMNIEKLNIWFCLKLLCLHIWQFLFIYTNRSYHRYIFLPLLFDEQLLFYILWVVPYSVRNSSSKQLKLRDLKSFQVNE
jgi:hypothetical protein